MLPKYEFFTQELYLKVLKSFCTNYGDQKFFSIWNPHNVWGQLFQLYLITGTYVMGLRQL